MKLKLLIFALLLALAGSQSMYSQGFKEPAPGKAAVYFVRVSSLGFAITFQYFDDDKYIGEFKGKNYMRVECNPGKQLLWISSENKEFIECDLKEGGTYIVLVYIYPGVMKARMETSPISATDERFQEAKAFVNAEKGIETSPEKIIAMNNKLQKFITVQLNDYNTKIKGIKEVDKITPDMAIPAESLK
jgi:hypothetical protein